MPLRAPFALLFAAVTALVVVSAPARAHADEDPSQRKVRLAYDAPAGCPSRDELIEPIAARVGYRPVDDAAADSATVQVQRDGAAFRAMLDLGDGRAARTFSGAACREVVQSVAIAIALTLDPILAPRREPPRAKRPDAEERVKPAAVSTRWPDIDPLEAPRGTPPPPEGPALTLTGGASTAVGLAPGVTLGPRAGVAFRWPRFALALEGRADLPLGSRTVSGMAIDASFVGAAVVPCVRRGWVFGCFEGTVGRYEASARASEPELVRTAADAFVLAGGRLGAEVATTERTRLVVSLFVAAPLTPVRILVADEAVWKTGPIATGLSLGAEWSP